MAGADVAAFFVLALKARVTSLGAHPGLANREGRAAERAKDVPQLHLRMDGCVWPPHLVLDGQRALMADDLVPTAVGQGARGTESAIATIARLRATVDSTNGFVPSLCRALHTDIARL